MSNLVILIPKLVTREKRKTARRRFSVSETVCNHHGSRITQAVQMPSCIL